MPTAIDPISSLAFSVSANKGVYALLLGSGVSRASSIPTGWEITTDLIRKVATLKEAVCEPDPAHWYEQEFGRPADYSELLDILCKSAAERQQLVKSYLEPTDAEREEGIKQPTAAHRAIASLVKAGYFRVIITTNFDKLMEMALQDVGVIPTVLSSIDHIVGAMPLVHTGCTIIKIHGDYLDTRILNTAGELAEYPVEFNKLLDRVFDEYGLIICGWSADWDDALRQALVRAPYRRFSTYWGSRGEPGAKALELIQRKGAHLIQIAGADQFFTKVSELVFALEEFAQPHPLSVQTSILQIKKYLSEPKYRIQLDDLIKGEVSKAIEGFHGKGFDLHENVNSESLGIRMHRYESIMQILIAMGMTAGQWADGDQIKPWLRAITNLSHVSSQSGFDVWLELRRYPACLLAYAIGLGAITSGNFERLKTVLSLHLHKEHAEDRAAVLALHPIGMFQRGVGPMQLLPGKDSYHAPLNSWVEERLKPLSTHLFQTDREFNNAFDMLEFLWSLAWAQARRDKHGGWVPVGNYAFRDDSFRRLVKLMRDSFDAQGELSPYVTCGLFGSTVTECEDNLKRLETEVAKTNRWY